MTAKSLFVRAVFASCVAGALLSTNGMGQRAPGSQAEKAPAGKMHPVVSPQATVVAGHARFSVLTPELIRMEWSATGQFEDHASLVFLNRELPVPTFTAQRDGNGVTIQTDRLRLKYEPQDAAEKFCAANLSVQLVLNESPVLWRPGMADTGNLLGTASTLDNGDGTRTKVPLGPGLISRDGWVVVDDSSTPLFDAADFSFSEGERSPWPWVLQRPPGEIQDWYFFGYGHEYSKALADFVSIAGPIPLPPAFAFGSWWSRYWAYSDEELAELVGEFRENNVPLDVLVVDMEWHKTQGMHYDQLDQSGNKLGWTGYSWNRLLFPSPETFLAEMHRQGLRVTLNLHPASGIQPWEDQYVPMAEAMKIDPASRKFVPFDITDKTFARNYLDILHHPLEKQGVDFWWLDWQQGQKTKIPELNPIWWLNYVHFTDQQREGKRPLLFHRWGGLGNHRYEIGFSGDTVSNWATLQFQPEFTATAANVGYAYWSHDIGGHIPGKVDPELYARWVQFGTFSPILRTHTTKNPEAERRIWTFPMPYSQIMRDSFQLRHALQPYIYTAARRTYDTGVAFVRPLYYSWPDEPEAYRNKDEYLFGDSMMVAPVTQPSDPISGLAEVSVWIPPGDWIEWQTGKGYTGPESIKRKVSLDQTPVYLRSGSIIPMKPEVRTTDGRSDQPTILTIFPAVHDRTVSYSLYEDDGEGETYKNGVCTWTKIDARRTLDILRIRIHPIEGEYPGMPERRAYTIRLPGDWPPDEVTINGSSVFFRSTASKKTGWQFDGSTLTTAIDVAAIDVRKGAEIVVKRKHPNPRLDADLDGFAGSLMRLRAAYDALNSLWPLTWSPDSLIDALQTGTRITDSPQSARAEVARFKALYSRVLETTVRLSVEPKFTKRAPAPPIDKTDPYDSGPRRESSSVLLSRALSLLNDGMSGIELRPESGNNIHAEAGRHPGTNTFK